MGRIGSKWCDHLLDGLEPARVWAILCRPLTRYILAWLACLGVAAGLLWYGQIAFNDIQRRDGNSGHVQIDFGGQWLMARMLVEGYGRELYNRDYQRRVLMAAYPIADQAPNAQLSDAEQLMQWLMGRDSPELERRVGGPLYPPIHALLHYPLGLLTPRQGYRAIQPVIVLLGFVAAWGIRQISRGRIWWPIAAAVILIYPGFSAAVNLGQNPVLTLTILVWGWYFLSRGHDGWGGAVWGLLAFKPVWATAFFLMLVLSGRGRACLAMLATGAALAALTLPLVGVQSWLDWLAVGREAALLYNVDENWIKSSRDLLSLPRRWLIDFERPADRRDGLAPALIGWALMAFVLEFTVRLAVLRRREARAGEGPPAAFLLLGAWLTCYHFMYYDVLLTVLPLLLLFTEPGRYLRPQLVALLPLPPAALGPAVRRYFEPRRADALPVPLPLLEPGSAKVAVLNGAVPTLAALILLSLYGPGCFGLTADKVPPFETYCLIALWLCCGWLWMRGTDRAATALTAKLATATAGLRDRLTFSSELESRPPGERSEHMLLE
ncbi:MAG TPA: glycosyltransferase family 87 protein [Gemmataceae bacterium]|nr:glycosyltransferase family 87 protein [Gemmataceae bacterium]